MLRAAALLVLLLCVSIARAEENPRAEAKRYFEAGDQAYKAGQYELAVRAYEEAHRRVPLPAITFSIAQAHRLAYYQDRDLEQLRKARTLYERYLAEAPNGNRRAHATQHLEMIDKILGAIEASNDAPQPDPAQRPAPPATLLMVASSTPGARARIGHGDPIEIPFASAVSPGRHRVRVEAAGYFSADSWWLAIKGRLVVAPVELVPQPAKLVVRAPAGADIHLDGRWLGVAPLAAESTTSAGQHTITISRRGHRMVARAVDVGPGDTERVEVDGLVQTDQRSAAYWVLGGALVLATGGAVTTVLAVAAEDRVQSYDERRGSDRLTEADRLAREDSLEARNDFRTASYVLFGSAFAVGAGGVLLYLLDTPNLDARPTARQGAGGRLQAAAGPGMLGAQWTWTH
jgi:tetratricopeptide (TPR) repeat protein